ncbi:hypothetical protein [Ornithobacterium rhinotracheale]|uniref:hypothetical protein n=1 Tax=Ornithobacterium rhinotracheale TaxID=28251 RepID=UPI00403723F9
MIKELIKTIHFEQGKDCKDYKALKVANSRNVIKVFKSGVDYCIKNKYPTDDILKKYADKCHGFYYKKQGDVYSDLDIAIFNSDLKLHFKNYEVADVFVRDSKVKVYAKDHSIVMLTAVGDCEIHTEGNVKVFYR